MNDEEQQQTAFPDPPPLPPDPPFDAPAAPSPAIPGFWQAVLLLALFLSFQIVGALILIAVTPKGVSTTDLLKEGRSIWMLAVANCVAFGVAIWVGIKWSGESWNERIRLGTFPPQLAGPFVTTTFGMLITAGAVAIATIAIVMNSPFKSLAERVDLPKGSVVGTLFLLAVVAPVTEELFFRGLVLGAFLRRYTERTALLASSALFGVMHLTPLQILPTFMIGMLLGWWRLRTGGVLVPILGHAIHNSVLGMVLLLGSQAQSKSPNPKLALLPALGGAAVALALGVSVLYSGMIRSREVLAPVPPPEELTPPAFGDVPTT